MASAAIVVSSEQSKSPSGKIATIAPPEKGWFFKRLDYEGIPIMAHKDYDPEAGGLFDDFYLGKLTSASIPPEH